MTSFRLRAGHHVFPVQHDGGVRWCHSTPDMSFHTIGGPAEIIAGVAEELRSGAIGADDLTGTRRTFVEALLDRGIVERVAPAGEDLSRGVVGIDAEPAADSAVGAVLSRAGIPVRPVDALVDDLEGLAALVVVAAVQRDRRWQDIDRRCAAAGVPWHRTYPEGDALVVGPMSVPGRSASYRDTRGRQLAASRTPDELESLWAHLDQLRASVPNAPIGARTAAEALVATDVMAWLHGDLLPAAGAQRVLRWANGTLTRHPVLPLPELAAR